MKFVSVGDDQRGSGHWKKWQTTNLKGRLPISNTPQASHLIVTSTRRAVPPGTKVWASGVMKPYSQHNSEKAQHIVGNEIQRKFAKLALMPVRHIFISKCGKGGKRAAKTCGHQQSPPIILVVGAPGKNIADNHAAQNV